MSHTAVPTRSTSRDLALVAVFVGVIAALGLVPALYPFGVSVPITAQTLGVILAGAVLGARRGALTSMVFLLLVAIGLPLLSGGRGGLAVFGGPSVGFLLGFPVAAYVVGWVTEKGGAPYKLPLGILANLIGGIGVLYLMGVPGIALVARIDFSDALASTWIFLPGDVLKCVVAALVASGVHRGYPGLIRRSRRHGAALAKV